MSGPPDGAGRKARDRGTEVSRRHSRWCDHRRPERWRGQEGRRSRADQAVENQLELAFGAEVRGEAPIAVPEGTEARAAAAAPDGPT